MYQPELLNATTVVILLQWVLENFPHAHGIQIAHMLRNAGRLSLGKVTHQKTLIQKINTPATLVAGPPINNLSFRTMAYAN
jgi:hypothetical protein